MAQVDLFSVVHNKPKAHCVAALFGRCYHDVDGSSDVEPACFACGDTKIIRDPMYPGRWVDCGCDEDP